MPTVAAAESSPLDRAFSALTEGELRGLALQTRTTKARDYLTREITGKSFCFDEFAQHIRDDLNHVILRPRAAALLARIVAGQRLKSTDSADALTIYERIIDLYGSSVLTTDDRVIFADVLDRAGNRATEVLRAVDALHLSKLAPMEAAALKSNAMLMKEGPSSKDWLKMLNLVLDGDHLSPLLLVSGSAPALDRIESTSQAESVDGPLVTVIVPTWNPGAWLWTAVRSVAQQTYANLQILVMDDCSDPAFQHEFNRIKHMDSRIQVVRNPKNVGSYASRNIAVRDFARGQYITLQDDDDWSHPQRIERQVEHAQSHGLALSLARATRVTDDLRFVRRSANFVQRGYPTTLVSRDTFSDIGFWDPARRNSDFEFIQRIRRTKKPWGDLGKSPLMFQRHREGSLSAAEVWEGYSDQARRWQNWLASAWYEQSSHSGRRIYMGSAQALPRPYPIPESLARNGSPSSAIEVDALIVHDYGKNGIREPIALNLAERLLDSGKTVGLLHIDGVRSLSGNVSSEVAKLVARDRVKLLTWDDMVWAETAHLVTVDGFLICDGVRSNISARRAISHEDLTGSEDVVLRLLHLEGSSDLTVLTKSSRTDSMKPG